VADIELIPESTKALLRRFLELRDAKEMAEAAADTAKKEYREAEAELHEALSEGTDGTLRVNLGPPWGTVSFLPQATPYATVINERKLEDYLEERQMMDEYSKPALVKGRLNELVREMDERGERMPPGLEIYKRRYIRVTRQKGKKS
jgi:hypothetical protein